MARYNEISVRVARWAALAARQRELAARLRRLPPARDYPDTAHEYRLILAEINRRSDPSTIRTAADRY